MTIYRRLPAMIVSALSIFAAVLFLSCPPAYGGNGTEQLGGFESYSRNFMNSIKFIPSFEVQLPDFSSQIESAIQKRELTPEAEQELRRIVSTGRTWSLPAIAVLIHCGAIDTLGDLSDQNWRKGNPAAVFAAAYLIRSGQDSPDSRDRLYGELSYWSELTAQGPLPYTNVAIYKPALVLALPILLEEKYPRIASALPVFLFDPLLDAGIDASSKEAIKPVFLRLIIQQYGQDSCALLGEYLQQVIPEYMPLSAQRDDVIRSGDYSSLVAPILEHYRAFCPNASPDLAKVHAAWEAMLVDLSDVSDADLSQLVERQQAEFKSAADTFGSGNLDAKEVATFLKSRNESAEELANKIARTWTYNELLECLAALESSGANVDRHSGGDE